MVRDTNPADKQNPHNSNELILSIRSLNTLHIPPAEIAKQLHISTDDVRHILAFGMTIEAAQQDLIDSVLNSHGCGVPIGAICKSLELTFAQARYIIQNRRLPTSKLNPRWMPSQQGTRS